MSDKEKIGLSKGDLSDLYHWLSNDQVYLDPCYGLDDWEIADIEDLRAKLAGMPTEIAGPLLHDAIKVIERQRADYTSWSDRYRLPEDDSQTSIEVITGPLDITEIAGAEALANTETPKRQGD